MKKHIIMLLLVVCIAMATTGCVVEQLIYTPQKTVADFIKALNEADIKKALESVEPSQAEAIDGMISLAGGYMGVDIDSLLEMAPFLGLVAGDYEGKVELKFKITGVEKEDDHAYVTGTLVNSEEEITFELVKEDGRWYISLESWF